MTVQSKSNAMSLLHNNMFWVSVLLVAAGSIGCFGYAGIQLKSTDSPPTQLRQDNDGQTKKLRSPILFERTTPTGPTLLST